MRINNTLFIGKVFIHLPEVPSTNVYAQQLLSKSLPIEGTVISTSNQTQGRGQIGSKWESQTNKNITLSVILYPSFLLPKEQFFLNQISSLAVTDLLAKYIENDIKVKWPNDIYIKDRKTSGILVQNTLSSHKIQSTIIGIGLNVNQESFSPDLKRATSLSIENKGTFELPKLTEELCQTLEQRYLQLKQGKKTLLQEAYLNRLYRFGEQHLFYKPDGTAFQGIIRGIDPIGKLLIEHNGQIESFQIKEIAFHDQ